MKILALRRDDSPINFDKFMRKQSWIKIVTMKIKMIVIL